MQQESPPLQTDRVLIVDDDRIIVEILKQSLSLAGYHVSSAYDGVEGLELARQSMPDIILLDVMMPKLDGYSVCQALKQDPETNMIPVIILTALTDRDDKLKALEVGADEFIRKPPDRQELLIRIKSLLRTKKLHDKVQASYQSLRELEQAKNDFTYMMVHDMRGPLGSIMSSLELLHNNLPKMNSEMRDVLLTSSLLAGRRIMTMMEAMLDVQRLESGQMPVCIEPASIRDVIKEAVQAVQPLLQVDQVHIDIKTVQPAESIPLDRELLERIMNNLLLNAIKFSPQGGRIGIWTQVARKWVIVNVADQGPGIPDSYREKVFEKFFQVEPEKRRTGVGLGLAFCKMAAEAMHGRIWVEDMPRAGALFRLALPYKNEKSHGDRTV